MIEVTVNYSTRCIKNMSVPNYPTSASLIVTFLENLKRYGVNRISGMNPTLINFNGKQMFVYIKNLSPAQLSNDNPDIWRIQLPKKDEFESIKKSDSLFLLFGYDYVRKVYTTWNPYWCKQRLNVAESCSMYSRLSLQKRVADKQEIEEMQLQNSGNVICIPSSLLGRYIINLKEYYPEESTYIPIGSSIQKRKTEEIYKEYKTNKTESELLFEKFKSYYDIKDFERYLTSNCFQSDKVSTLVKRLVFVFENRFIDKHKEFFLECKKIEEYKRAINRFCWCPEIRPYEELWDKNISTSLKQYLLFVEEKMYWTPSNPVKLSGKDASTINTKINKPDYTLDQFGKLIALDSIIVERLLPSVRGVDYPDYGSLIKQVIEYYPEEATKKMTPVDWMKLFNSTKWQKRRGRKAASQEVLNHELDTTKNKVPEDEYSLRIGELEVSNDELNTTTIQNPPKRNVDTRVINKVFDKRVTSYKYFWFISIISIAKQRNERKISYVDIVTRMAALAWPIVMRDDIDLGTGDMLSKILSQIKNRSYLIKDASSSVVESFLKTHYKDKGINYLLLPLLNNVPYRFLSPWIKYTSNQEVSEKSRSVDFAGPYSLYSDCIVFFEEWLDYIKSNYSTLCDFTFQSFLSYAKQYNNELKLLNIMKNGWSII